MLRDPLAVHWTTVAWLFAGLSLATLPFLDVLPLWLTPMLVGMGVWRLRLSMQGRPAPSGRIRAAVAVTVISLLVLSGKLGLGLQLALPLFVTLLWIKLFELNTPRDVHMAVFLSFFLLAGDLMANPSLLHWVACMTAGTVLLGAMAHFHLGSEARRGGGPGWRALRLGALIGAQGLPVAVVLFLFIPRPDFALSPLESQARVGISDTMNPGEVARLAEDQSVAFRVEFPRGTPPALADCYWRGLVLSAIDGDVWRAARRNDNDGEPPTVFQPDGAVELVQEVTLNPTAKKWAFALDVPVQPLDPFLRLHSGAVLEAQSNINGAVTYRVASATMAQVIDNLEPPQPQLRINRDPRLLDLAMQWRASGNGDPAAIAQAGLDWVGANGFRYTREPGAFNGPFIAPFLFERKAGFCSHYAAAYALVLNLAGVPARVVVGYHGAETNPFGNFMVVRQSHAHAWTEGWWLGSWHRIDPTEMVTETDPDGRNVAPELAAAARARQQDPGRLGSLMKNVRQRWDWVEARWNRWALGYDKDTQMGLLERFGLHFAGMGGTIALIVMAVSGLGLALGVMALVMSRRRRAQDPLVRGWQDLCRRMAKVGVTREPHEGPATFGRRAATSLPHHAAELLALTAEYAQLRYAQPANLVGDRRAWLRRVARYRPTRPAPR